MTHWQLLLMVGGVGCFGIACFWAGESFKVRYLRWRMRDELREAQREMFSQLR